MACFIIQPPFLWPQYSSELGVGAIEARHPNYKETQRARKTEILQFDIKYVQVQYRKYTQKHKDNKQGNTKSKTNRDTKWMCNIERTTQNTRQAQQHNHANYEKTDRVTKSKFLKRIWNSCAIQIKNKQQNENTKIQKMHSKTNTNTAYSNKQEWQKNTKSMSPKKRVNLLSTLKTSRAAKLYNSDA